METSPEEPPAGNAGPAPSWKANLFPRAKEIVAPAGLINTAPLALASQVGKNVILVDFWTYSCINCQRTTPYLNAWWGKYKDQGLLEIEILTPGLRAFTFTFG